MLASFTDAGVQGIRLRKKKQVIKGVPRVMNSHDRESYWVFQGLTTAVSAGEALVLVSRDPARTSAVLRVWADLLPIDVGEVRRPDRSMLLAAPQSRWVRELSVEQTIRLLAGIYGFTDAEVEQMVGPVAQTAQVGGLLHRPIEELGKQYRQQIAFAIAVHAPVDLLLFDHTAVLGTPEFRSSCPDQLLALREAGRALVVVTDRPKIALQVGTAAVIVRGRRADQVSVAEAAEFLIRDEAKGRKKRPRREEDDDDDDGMEV